jgi:hypothetical protein
VRLPFGDESIISGDRLTASTMATSGLRPRRQGPIGNCLGRSVVRWTLRTPCRCAFRSGRSTSASYVELSTGRTHRVHDPAPPLPAVAYRSTGSWPTRPRTCPPRRSAPSRQPCSHDRMARKRRNPRSDGGTVARVCLEGAAAVSGSGLIAAAATRAVYRSPAPGQRGAVAFRASGAATCAAAMSWLSGMGARSCQRVMPDGALRGL